VTQLATPNFALRYQSAWRSYQTDWQHIDIELVKLIQAHNSGSFEDIHLRVVFMNGVYRAQLNRTIGSNADFLAARALHATWPRIRTAIAPLATFATPNIAAMQAVVAAHGLIVAILSAAFPNAGRTTSFASKYLWPDAPNLVPIFDGNTDGHARRHRVDYAAAIPPIRAAMGGGQGDVTYLDHTIRYLATYQMLSAANLPPGVLLTMKGIDHMYWLA
jgi:hypothetical protein